MTLLRLEITVDRDWVALNLYRMALERIVQLSAKEPWAFSGEEAGAIAVSVLKQFPGSEKK